MRLVAHKAVGTLLRGQDRRASFAHIHFIILFYIFYVCCLLTVRVCCSGGHGVVRRSVAVCRSDFWVKDVWFRVV